MIQSKNKNSYLIAFVFALSIFTQSVLFHYLIYHEILFSSLWTHTADFFRFYLPHISIALFLASFVFLFKNRWWTVAVSVFIDIWILANLWYYRANNILIDKYAVTMIGNLNGFWDSILALIKPVDLVFLALTVLVVVVVGTSKTYSKSIRLFFTILAMSIICGLFNGVLLAGKYGNDYTFLNPLKEYGSQKGGNQQWFVHLYAQEHSIIHYFAYTTNNVIKFKHEDNYSLSNNDIRRITHFIQPSSVSLHPKTPLIICIIESLNSFAINNEIMPSLSKFIDTTQSLLICNQVVSQTKGGTSADGQMIIISGLLPLNSGAACYRFPFNKYPSILKNYNNCIGIFPHDMHVWNQGRMNHCYKIDSVIISSASDRELFSKTVSLSKVTDNILILTSSTHIPCTQYSDSSSLILSDTIPSLLKNYLKSANVLDKGMQILFNEISSNKNLKNSTIVITGDHCLPVPSDEDFGGAYDYSRFIPLIIYSPEIKEKTIITDTCYQMDIYPTILHLIGCEDYYWKGFGVNLLDSATRHNRPITQEEAYDLSDKMIRADYFKRF